MEQNGLQTIEKQIRAARIKEAELCKAATQQVKDQIKVLDEERVKLRVDILKQRDQVFEKLYPIIGEVIALTVQITMQGKYCLWFDWSGHVQWFQVRGHRGENRESADSHEILKTCRCEVYENRTIEQVEKNVLDMRDWLLKLRDDPDFNPINEDRSYDESEDEDDDGL